LLHVPFLVVILFFWDPEASAPEDESEWSLPVEMLEVLMLGGPADDLPANFFGVF
jgi:hypothetical protein